MFAMGLVMCEVMTGVEVGETFPARGSEGEVDAEVVRVACGISNGGGGANGGGGGGSRGGEGGGAYPASLIELVVQLLAGEAERPTAEGAWVRVGLWL